MPLACSVLATFCSRSHVEELRSLPHVKVLRSLLRSRRSWRCRRSIARVVQGCPRILRRRRPAAINTIVVCTGPWPVRVSTIVVCTGILQVSIRHAASMRLSKVAGSGFTPGCAVASVGAPPNLIAFTMLMKYRFTFISLLTDSASSRRIAHIDNAVVSLSNSFKCHARTVWRKSRPRRSLRRSRLISSLARLLPRILFQYASHTNRMVCNPGALGTLSKRPDHEAGLDHQIAE